MTSTLRVFTTARAIREYTTGNREASGFLETIQTIDDFEKRLLLFPGKRNMDGDTRTILLGEAAAFQAFDFLKIDREFFKFLRHTPFLLRFFEELSSEEVELDRLERNDTYAEYDRHLAILKTLKERYETLLEEHGFLDRITVPKTYELNTGYLKRFSAVHLHVDGYPTRFEFRLFREIAARVPFHLHLETTPYSGKLLERLEEFPLQADRRYELDLTGGTILEETPLPSKLSPKLYACKNRLLQIAVIRKKVYDFVQKGIAPEKIAVILPDESFRESLELFDRERNFNYAMGRSFAFLPQYKRLEALARYLTEENPENRARLSRLEPEWEERVETWKPRWNAIPRAEETTEFLTLFRPEKGEAAEKFDDALFRFLKLEGHLAKTTLEKRTTLFLNRLDELTLDDVGGGKITVMGILETRGAAFDGVIIVDFNEGFVPAESLKDMFINSHVRKKAGLPTRTDRQNLQKSYYHRLLAHAKQAAVCYTDDEERPPSRFLRAMKITGTPEEVGEAWSALLYPPVPRPARKEPEIVEKVNLLAGSVSASRLKTWLTCKRKYYHRYEGKLEEAKLPSLEPEPYEVGNLVHNALQALYQEIPHFEDPEELQHQLEQRINAAAGANRILAFDGRLWGKRLEAFARTEVERFKNGFRVHALEAELTAKVGPFTLKGRIDRIDEKDGDLFVLDYKTGSYEMTNEKKLEETTDFQLVFYHHLARNLGPVEACGIYDLKKGEIVFDPLIEEKKEFLELRLHQMAQPEQNFEKTDNRQRCRYCEYQLICGRD